MIVFTFNVCVNTSMYRINTIYICYLYINPLRSRHQFRLSLQSTITIVADLARTPLFYKLK